MYCKQLREEKLGYGMQLKLTWEVKREEEWGQTVICSNTVWERPKNVLLIYLLKRKKIIITGMAGLQLGLDNLYMPYVRIN